MLKDQDIICISSIDWDFIWQGHQEIMSTLAKNGNRIIFIENTGIRVPGIRDLSRLSKRIKNYFKGVKGIRKEMDNLYIFSPIVLPFPYSRIATRINRALLLSTLERWMKAVDFNNPIIWIFLPNRITLDIIDNINTKLIVYYCIDNFAVSSAAAKKVKQTEKRLLKQADLVFVTSRALYDYCRQYNKYVTIFPFGVSIAKFEKARTDVTDSPAELTHIRQPIVGYVGGIHKWVDQNLVKYLAETYPNYSFVFVGPIQTDISLLSGIKNIYFLGNKNHQDLPYLIKNFSVCIIPYLITDYTRNVYPTKLNEYLAMGKPVVSTNLPEIESFNQKYEDIVYSAKKPEDFAAYIETAMEKNTEALQKRYLEVADDNSWHSRIKQMCGLIEEALERKMLDRDAGWIASLRSFYRTARKRFVRVVASFVLAYLLLFYTPFFWFIAAPLKIADNPQKSDVIVVFAGGVGESGRAGQGYEERVQYAVELYKNGYAGHLFFSSGYMYIFEEPLLMKALAVSLGVPEEAIILEDKARNTYENVKFTKEILTRNGWSKILLVSSPYHMRRVSLVVHKFAKDLNVNYTPVPKNLFYAHATHDIQGRKIWKQITLKQIKGILHEYSGILYYYLKGYI